jgi:CRP/FNR family transcriptional regulator
MDMPSKKNNFQRLISMASFLKNVPMFCHLSTEHLTSLAQVTTSIRLASGDTLFNQGDTGDALYLIRKGMISIRVNGAEVGVLGRYDCLGELAVIEEAPRSGAAVAVTNVSATIISSENFNLVQTLHPSISLTLMRTISNRLREREAMMPWRW